jgi:hypothetical protein
MSTETQPIVVTEFLRPENSHEGVIYHVPPDIAEKVEALNVKGLTVCCDIFPLGRCFMYIYDPISDCVVEQSQHKMHSIAESLLIELIRNFDLSSYP